MYCHYLPGCVTIRFLSTINVIRSSSPTVCVGQGDSSPVSMRPASGVEPEDPVENRTLSVKTDTGLVEEDGRESKYITDVIPRKISRISDKGQFLSGKSYHFDPACPVAVPIRKRITKKSATL